MEIGSNKRRAQNTFVERNILGIDLNGENVICIAPQTHIEIFDYMRGITAAKSMAEYFCANESLILLPKWLRIVARDAKTIKTRSGFEAIKSNVQSTSNKN